MLNKNKMLFLSIILAIITGSLIWKFFIENSQINDYEIPISQNIAFNDQLPKLIDSAILEKEFENNHNKPITVIRYYMVSSCLYFKIKCNKRNNYPQVKKV